MIDYFTKACVIYDSIDELESYITSDMRNCKTFGDIITAFNFWFGFVSGWCQNNPITYDRQYACYRHLKDLAVNHLLYISELDDVNIKKELLL